MKKFTEYSDILNIKKEKNQYTDIEKQKMKNSVLESIGFDGGYEIFEAAGYDYIMLYETELVNLIKQKSEEYDIAWGSQFIQTLVTWMLQPIATKLGLQKESLGWYMVTWGLVESVFEFKDEITKLDKQPVNWCNVFAKGASTGIIAWSGTKGLNKLMSALGFNITGNDPTGIIKGIETGIIAWLTSETVHTFIEDKICNEGGLWDMFIDEAGDILSNIGSGVMNIGSSIFGGIKSFFN